LRHVENVFSTKLSPKNAQFWSKFKFHDVFRSSRPVLVNLTVRGENKDIRRKRKERMLRRRFSVGLEKLKRRRGRSDNAENVKNWNKLSQK
jgi:hypothetical protein